MAELSKEQVQERFMNMVFAVVDARTADIHDAFVRKDAKRRILTTLFTIFAEVDGESGSFQLPGFILAPAPHPRDKDYRGRHDSDWFPEFPAQIETEICDIAGTLHHDVAARLHALSREG